MPTTIYEKNGYFDRNDYLSSLADEFGVDFDVVLLLADMLGPDEDFDGLINALEDYEEYGYAN